MTGGQRCDEIIHIIDAALAEVADGVPPTTRPTPTTQSRGGHGQGAKSMVPEFAR